ncbi:MmgE/PrpD family protein [Sphingobium sp. HWE2-09]|uniref:MmgE/PrpD family protein n=1 Tax=Sphingobium sp. HWE2-09 TaxID=3108390 RepID=UPI002DC2E5FF|nr:MmgE/PrpD family protein [Sphingobium sp. HWE2-09]
MSASETLIDHALGIEWAAVPAPAREATRIFLHDSLCVGVAGRNAAHADAVLAIAQGWGEGGSASVLGRPGLTLPAASAAFVNAFQIHGQEYDCVHEPAVLHPMATVLAALLGEAERGAPVSGSDFLGAIVAGVDVAVTLGLAATGPLSFFRPATAGIFGCVAAITRLRRMERQQALDAFGHALAFASGTMQAHVEGKPALPVQVANAARSSLVAIDLARAGMPGVAAPIDGPFGYLALQEVSHDLPAALALLAQGHRITEVSWKPFPTGRAGHGGIVATQRLMAEQGLRPEWLERLDYHAPPLIHRLVGRPTRPHMEPGYARLCLPWLIAVTLTRGTVSLADFRRESLDDPALLALAARIAVVNDGNADPAAFVPARAVARLSDGRSLDMAIDAQLGSPQWPLTRQQHDDKALGCLSFGGLPAAHQPLIDAVAGLHDSDDAIASLRATGIMGAA